MYYYYYLFYKIYKWAVITKNSTPVHAAFATILIFITLTFADIFLIFDYFFDIKKTYPIETLRQYFISIVIFLTLYQVKSIFYKKNYLKVIEKFDTETKSQAIIGGILVGLYLILSLLMFYLLLLSKSVLE